MKTKIEKNDLKALIDYINDEVFKTLVNNSNQIGTYAFKGGYILSRYKVKKARSTSDIDMSVDSVLSFNLIIKVLTPLLERLKSEGYIYNYKIKYPVVTETKNNSGGIAFYHKVIDNLKAFKFCGLDIGVHNLSYGLVRLSDGVTAFSDERSISDKLFSLFNSSPDKICRRCRDIYDIYLYSYILNVKLDRDVLLRCLKERNVDIYSVSSFERVLHSSDECNNLKNSLRNLLTDGKRVDIEFIIKNNITISKLVSSVLEVIDYLRRNI